MITTTLNRIREHQPCVHGWTKLLKHLGKTQADDEPLPFSIILESNGFDDALWCCRAEPQYAKEWRLYAVWCGRQVQHLMTDQGSRAALDVAERYANGQASDADRDAARDAWDAARAAARDAAGDAWAAARDAARDAWAAAWDAARDAAGDAARDAWAAARDAARADAWDAAGDAAWDAAGGAARDAWDAAGAAQAAEFLRVVTETEVQS